MEYRVGSCLHGFKVKSIERLPEIDGRAIVMSHTKSDARLLLLKNQDNNKAFSITFKTPPADSTGVFHVIEHSVLCGSKKFPAKRPFVNLLKNSMKTFLNAMTYPDKTMYAAASTNGQDLANLMDVYMDSVFSPNVYGNRAIFDQEGWHYELNPEESHLRYNGVVLNEMKGVFSSSDSVLYNALMKNLFPDTAYAFESGGDPKDITDLTYEQCLDSHRRHYHPENSYIVLYGNLDDRKYLAHLDENYLSKYKSGTSKPNPLEVQEPVVRMNVKKRMQTAHENACMGIGYVAGHASDRARILRADILIDALMGGNESPLKKALLESGIASDYQGYLCDGQLQPVVVVQAKGSEIGHQNRLLSVIEKTVSRLVEEGIPRDKLEATISRGEFKVRERDFGIPAGVALAQASLSGWLYDDSMPTDYLQYDAEFKAMRSQIEEGYFEQLARELFLENNHIASVEIVPYESVQQSEESKRLEAIKSRMDLKDIQRVKDNMRELLRFQVEPDTLKTASPFPPLSLETTGSADDDLCYTMITTTSPLCLYHNLPTQRIDYVYYYFDLNRVAYEDLPYVAVLIRLLGKFDTEKYTAGNLDDLVRTRLGKIRFFIESYCQNDDPFAIEPKLVVEVSSLEENVDYLATIPSEIWGTTDFSNTGKIKDILQQYRIGMEQAFTLSGHVAAKGRLASYYVPSAVIRDDMGGVGFYRFIKNLLDEFNDKAESLVENLYRVSDSLFSHRGLVISFTGTPEERERFWKASEFLRLSNGTACKKLVIPEPVNKREAFIIPTSVCFTSKGYDRRLLNAPYTGAWQVASSILSLDYLWKEVRLKGGSYGVGFNAEPSGALQFFSFRDPNLDKTISCFDMSGSWLESFDPKEDEMHGYVAGSIARHDAPKKACEIAWRQDCEFFSGVNCRWKARQEILDTDASSIRALASVLKDLAEKGAECVFGGRDVISSSKRNLEVIDLFDSRSGS